MRRPHHVIALAAVASAALLGSSCANQGDGIDATTKTLLQHDVQTLTSAAAKGDYAAARAATSTITADLAAAAAAGKITDTKLAQIRASVLKVQTTLSATHTPTPTPPPSRTTPPSTRTTQPGDGQNGDGGD